jgi:GT2 family glycosyltransferase
MSLDKSKIFIGFIIFGEQTFKYLPSFLNSLQAQSLTDFKILVFNNGDDKGVNSDFIRREYPNAKFLGSGDNLGFSAAYNAMIAEAVRERADYFWVTNPDIVYNSDALEKLVARLDGDQELGSVCPKLLRWDFESNTKTDIVDSYGIEMRSGLRFFDFGQGEKDHFDLRYGDILGPSGASGLYRLSALEKIKENGLYFDENFFMYKEDCDLDYRLMLAEWETAVVPEAVGWHDRTAFAAGKGALAAMGSRKVKSPKVKSWSLANQLRIFLKYWKLQDIVSKLRILTYLAEVLVYAALFERFLLRELADVWRARNDLIRYG